MPRPRTPRVRLSTVALAAVVGGVTSLMVLIAPDTKAAPAPAPSTCSVAAHPGGCR